MQILQWLFKVTHEEQARQTVPSPTNKDIVLTVQEADSRDLVLFKSRGRGLTRRSKRIEEVNARVCFYNTLNLKRLGGGSFHKREKWVKNSMRVKEEELMSRGLGMGHKVDSGSSAAAAHVGNKVLPICDTTVDQCGSLEKKDRPKGEKSRAISRMKELLRWAAAAKTEEGGKYIGRKVLNFRNRGGLKGAPQDDQLSIDSPKISFRWDAGSCSTSSSAYSARTKPSLNSNAAEVSVSDHNTEEMMLASSRDKDRFTSRTGNWITTDADFVVLEL